MDFLAYKLHRRREDGLLRQLSVTDPSLIDFSSNDYLGFAKCKDLWEPEPLDKYGSTGSRLLTGNSAVTEETEIMIASFHHAEAGLIYNSGYDANTGLFSCIAGKDDTIIYDENCHASIKDGARLSLAKHYSFRHNDPEHLESKIQRAQGNVFVAVESVYSMDGDSEDLKGLATLTEKYKHVYLIVDEAHATGIFGDRGEGLIQEYGLQDRFFARVHTFGKALGCQGAIVLGSNMLRDYLINFSRPFIYTTALPLHNILAIKRAYQLLEGKDNNIRLLKKCIRYFNKKASVSGIPNVKLNDSAIQVIIISGNENAKAAAKHLQSKGFDIRPVLSPTVPAGTERLRICIHSYNTEAEIDGLVDKLKSVGENFAFFVP